MNIKIIIRFYEELNDFLPRARRKQDLSVEVQPGTTVGELIGSMGPPCSAVDMILVNGQSAGFDYILEDNDRVSVYPVFERLNIEPVSLLENAPLRRFRFICDVHLGRLAKYLRMLGFDTLYKNDYDDNMLIRLSNSENRILVSRDTRLLLNKSLLKRYRVTHSEPGEQIRELIQYFDLKHAFEPMSRCLECNSAVHTVSKDTVRDRVDPKIYHLNDVFTECSGCGKLFWKGSHYDSMMRWIQKMMD